MKKIFPRYTRLNNPSRLAGQHRFTRAPLAHAGYTLIELILYISILGSLLTAMSLYFSTTTQSRVKNQSIAEVTQQGILILERITQAIRNADSINSPTAGNSASALTITTSGVQTVFDINVASQVLGYNGTGTNTDDADSNIINASKFVAAASGNISTLYAYVASPIGSNPNNKAQMAIYSGASNPSALLASSADVTLTGDAWNSFPISTVAVTSGQTYWLAYNTNGTVNTQNNLRRHAGTTNQAMWTNRTYALGWPASFNANLQDYEFSMYADIVTGGAGTAIRSKDGAAAAVTLSNTKVQISGLTFTNLTRSGTPGTVRVSFTIARANSANRNEYDYQKTFTGSAALR